MNLLDRLKFKKWTEWEYLNSNSCIQTRTRLDDSSISETRVVHNWKEQYAEEDSCLIIETCNCGIVKEIGEVHPSYNTKYKVYSEQICSRCGKQLDGFMNC